MKRVLFAILTGTFLAYSVSNATTQTTWNPYNGSTMPKVMPPKGSKATICFGGGCAGQTWVNFAKFDELLRSEFGEPKNAVEERVAISRAVSNAYRFFKPYMKPKAFDNFDDQSWIREGLQYQNWECKTHAQNVIVVVHQLERLHLLRWHKLGAALYSGQHYYGSLIAYNGDVYQLDTYFGNTIYSIEPNCVSGQAVCIRKIS